MYKLWYFECPDGHIQEALVEHEERVLECPVPLPDGRQCPWLARRILSATGRLLWYGEGRARVDYHLGHEPVEITSEKQHQELMKKAGVTLAGTRRGMPGQWI